LCPSYPGAPLLPSHPKRPSRTDQPSSGASRGARPSPNQCVHPPSLRAWGEVPPGVPLRRKFPAEGTICRHGKRDQHAPDASRAPLTVPTGAPTTFASVPHGSHREPPLLVNICQTPQPHAIIHSEAKNPPSYNTNCRRWNTKPPQVDRHTAAGGTPNCRRWAFLCTTCHAKWALVRSSAAGGKGFCPPAAVRLPTCCATAPHLPHHCLLPAHLRHLWGRSTVCLGKVSFWRGHLPQGFGLSGLSSGISMGKVPPLKSDLPQTQATPSPNIRHPSPRQATTSRRQATPYPGKVRPHPKKDPAEGITSGGCGRSRGRR
jgi:hypothetical protein